MRAQYETYMALNENLRLLGVNASSEVPRGNIIRRLLQLDGIMGNSNSVKIHLPNVGVNGRLADQNQARVRTHKMLSWARDAPQRRNSHNHPGWQPTDE